MKICKIICGFISIDNVEIEEYDTELNFIENTNDDEIGDLKEEEVDEIIKDVCGDIEYLNKIFVEDIRKDKKLFTSFQKTRQINLQHLINIIGTLHEGFIERNLKLEKTTDYSDENFLRNHLKPLLIKLNKVAKFIIELFEADHLNNWWINKSNLYSLMILFYNNDYYLTQSLEEVITKLNNFIETEKFETYKLLCHNSVNNKTVRIERNQILETIFKN